MKRLLVLAAVAALMIAGPASAQWGRHAVAQPNATFAFGAGGTAGSGPSTTNNDDSCDIGVAPAATLLLPYFQVETASRGTDTFFTITNTSNVPQIAHVTIWTDWSFPVLDFNIFLTGYDVQAVSLYDIIVGQNGSGIIANVASGTTDKTAGTGIGANTGTTAAPKYVTGFGVTTNGKTNGGTGSVYNALNMVGNPNFNAVVYDSASYANCLQLPGQLRSELTSAIKSALVTGTGYKGSGFGCNSSSDQVGSAASTHPTATTAVGYVTVDVAAACNQLLPTDPTYYTGTIGILYDNVLTGDYEIIDKSVGTNYAGGNPLVHIRAVPEGGIAGSVPTNGTNLPYTFYSRYSNTADPTTNVSLRDRRQPLPSVFAARWIQGGPVQMNTNYRIWREGYTSATDCNNAVDNSEIPITEVVRFDEHENFLTNAPSGCTTSPCPKANTVVTPETSSPSVSNTSIFPPATFSSGDVGGWMYLNLDVLDTTDLTWTFRNATTRGVRASQNWVVVALSGTGSSAGAYSVDFDATWLGNGCSGQVALTTFQTGGTSILGPVGGTPVCPAGAECVKANYPGTNATP